LISPHVRPARVCFLALLLVAGSSALAVASSSARSKQAAANSAGSPPVAAPKDGSVRLSGPWEKSFRLAAGETVEISVHLDQPSTLPPNGRVGVEWSLRGGNGGNEVTGGNGGTAEAPRTSHFPISSFPPISSPGWRKVLHALDGDVYLLYRAPAAGRYTLKLTPVAEEAWVGDTPRWREKGVAPELFPLPKSTPWPAGVSAPVSVSVRPVDAGAPGELEKSGALIETEPNDTAEQAIPLTLVPNAEVKTYEITGTADDIEYFDNGRVGESGDDWYRVELAGREPRLVTALLAMPGQAVAARIRTYRQKDSPTPNAQRPAPLAVEEWSGAVNPNRLPYTEGKQVEVPEGKDPNERAHQQAEEHRVSISRIMEPGRVYFLRVEANAPAYGLQIRVLRPAPYTDPRLAVRQAMYNHIGQVDSWLSNRPRGGSVERRIRDSGNLLGTQCMSCHTQSGVWGPAVPIKYGYRIENVLNEWHLLNIMYECLRPTNELKEAAVNTSLSPLDVGDGPAGTRAAGFNIVNAEENFPARKLHSKQQLRTANYMLQTSDPGGINAAGPGSNIGQNIVALFASEVLYRAWKDTGDPKYFRLLEVKAANVLVLTPKFTDDIGVRMDYFGRFFPKDYPAQAQRAADAEKTAGQPVRGGAAQAEAFLARVREQLAEDEKRLRAIQLADGSWGFSPGTESKLPEGGKWTNVGGEGDPSPTALAIMGLTAAGRDRNDPAVAKAVQWLLKVQDANGRWNRASITGFVPTAYVLRALAPLYPVTPYVPKRAEFTPRSGETLTAAVRRVQALAMTRDPKLVDLMLQAARNQSPLVRYWAMVGLGLTHTEQGVPAVVAALREKNKPVRDAAAWALKQTLLDDRGWEAAIAALEKGDDYAREGVVQALGMRADAVMPRASVSWERLGRLLDRAMNDDAHPGVRAWAGKAAWQWWIWNPPLRPAINEAWVRLLERPESSAVVENSNRYSSHALFIANGHRQNGSRDHLYKELATLFETLRTRLEKSEPGVKSLLAKRLVSVAGTFYGLSREQGISASDGGPGPLGYTTPGSGALFGQAAVVYLRETMPSNEVPLIRAGLQGAASIPHGPLQEYLTSYALSAPEELRKDAADAVSDPRSAMLEASNERIEPLVEQIRRGAADPGRRASLSDPVLKLFEAVNWVISPNEEKQRLFFDMFIPKFEQYTSEAELASIADGGLRAQRQREMDAAWYLADRMGQVVASNPDLHQPLVFQRFFPVELKNPLERHFWVRSVPWLLEHNTGLPEVAAAGKPSEQKADPTHVIKDRAIQLYLDSLGPDTPARTRSAAIRISNQTAVRKNPEVLLALSNLLKHEKDEELRKIAERVVSQGAARFVPDLVAAVREEKAPGRWLTEDGKLNPTFEQDITYFRDYIVPELARVKRTDQATCMGCHGVPGRVPSFFLKPVDQYGYQSVPDLLANYREVQSRVNLADPDRSKILRKPLNIQDGKEDGHQGGRRYLPTDEGYLILKRWVENQAKVNAAAGAPTAR